MTEIKKAFETFKKEIKKEAGLEGGFTMSKRQIELRTATYLVNNMRSYEDEIRRLEEIDEKIKGFENWTDEEKERRFAEHAEGIKYLTSLKEKFGTKENEFKETLKTIENSKAFAKLQETTGKIVLTTEIKENFYNYIRFNY